MKGILLYFVVGLFVVGFLILLPHGTIWAINELFDLTIAHDRMNWLASLFLTMLVGAQSTGGSNK